MLAQGVKDNNIVGMLIWFKTNKRLVTIVTSTAGFIALCLVVLVVVVSRPKTAVDAGQVLAAVTNFCATHRPLPQSVTFSQLIAEGYLGSNVLQEFGASEVTVFLNGNETSPQMILMDALMPDGSHTVALSDGSVQGFSNSRFQQAVQTNGGSATPSTDSAGSGADRHR